MKRLFLACLFCVFFAGSMLAVDPAPVPMAPPGRPKLVDLGADKCIPCKMMAPVLADLSKEYAGQLDVVFIDVWKTRGEGERYGIRVIPTQIFYSAEGKELFRHEGFYAKKDILANWKALGVELKEPSPPKGN